MIPAVLSREARRFHQSAEGAYGRSGPGAGARSYRGREDHRLVPAGAYVAWSGAVAEHVVEPLQSGRMKPSRCSPSTPFANIAQLVLRKILKLGAHGAHFQTRQLREALAIAPDDPARRSYIHSAVQSFIRERLIKEVAGSRKRHKYYRLADEETLRARGARSA